MQSRVAVPAKHAQAERIDADGLPHVGAVVWPKQSYYTTVDTLSGARLRPATCSGGSSRGHCRSADHRCTGASS